MGGQGPCRRALIRPAMTMVSRSSRKRRAPGGVALGMVVAGALLLLVGGGYFLYSWVATKGLESLVYTPPTPGGATGAAQKPLTLAWLRPQASASPSPDAGSLRLYPGEYLPFYSWAQPWAVAEVPVPLEAGVEGFLPLGQFAPAPMGSLPPATRIRIPAIELEAEVRNLAIVNLGDDREYETPKFVVGHIPQSAGPGEVGNNWLFGHLESRIRNEGAVFQDLPKVPEVLRRGQRVYVFLESSLGSYLYEVAETRVVHGTELWLYPSDQPILTLVTCVPPITYDYRLLVTARLVGFKPP
ncbi:MAG: sortase [Chloroflexi bacterium]|nr:sortase [Chloroflexota bacterium]